VKNSRQIEAAREILLELDTCSFNILACLNGSSDWRRAVLRLVPAGGLNSGADGLRWCIPDAKIVLNNFTRIATRIHHWRLCHTCTLPIIREKQNKIKK
jgi:hypothetical protein